MGKLLVETPQVCADCGKPLTQDRRPVAWRHGPVELVLPLLGTWCDECGRCQSVDRDDLVLAGHAAMLSEMLPGATGHAVLSNMAPDAGAPDTVRVRFLVPASMTPEAMRLVVDRRLAA